jgi:cytochrome c-type biogenesis protein CcmE
MKRTSRLWMEIVTLCAGVAFGLGLGLAALGAVTLAFVGTDSAQAADTATGQTYEGMITDMHCGAKHSAKIGASASDCTRLCVHSGEKFALVKGEQLYMLEGESTALKRVAGQRARVVGTLSGNTITVASVNSAT